MNKFVAELIELGNNMQGTVIKGNREEIKQSLTKAFEISKQRSKLVTNETEYLLSSKKNRDRLLESVANIKEGKVKVHNIKLDEDEPLNIGHYEQDLSDVISKVAFEVLSKSDRKMDMSSLGKPKSEHRIKAEQEDDNTIYITTVEEAEFIAERLNSNEPPNENLRKAFERYNEYMADPEKMNDLLRIKQEQDIDYDEFEKNLRKMKTVDTLHFENLIIHSSLVFDEFHGDSHKEYCVTFTDQGGTNCFSSVKDVVQFAKDWSNFKC